MNNYYIGVREIVSCTYIVQAETEEQAKEIMENVYNKGCIDLFNTCDIEHEIVSFNTLADEEDTPEFTIEDMED